MEKTKEDTRVVYSKSESPFGTWDILVEGTEADDGDGLDDIDGVYIGVKKRNGMFRQICELSDQSLVLGPEEAQTTEPGNARLILAAPLMYETLKDIQLWIAGLKSVRHPIGIAFGQSMGVKVESALRAAENYELPYKEYEKNNDQ